MPSDNVEGRRAPRQMVRPQDRAAGSMAAVRQRVAHRAVDVIAPDAWVVDGTGFPKDGLASPGVARQYCGSLGKVGNCQIGVSVHAVTDVASCPLSWRLFLPASLRAVTA